MSSDPRTSRKGLYGQIAFLTVFTLFWTVCVGFFDGFMVRNLIRQQQAASFPTTMGVVTTSELERSTSSDGVSYRPHLVFQYSVEGREYSSDTWRFDAVGMSDATEPQRIVDQYPVGAEVEVYYNPDDPAVAVLEPGVTGTDHFLAIFLAPFNFVGLVVWGLLAQSVRLAVTNPPAGGVSIRHRGETTIARLPRFPPLLVGLFAACLVCFFSIFIGGIVLHFSPPMWFVSTVWISAVLVGGAVFLWRSFVVGSGAKDLVIDPVTRVLDLPRSMGRKEPTVVPFDSIRQLVVREERSSSSNGGQSTSYCPAVVWTAGDGSERTDKITEFNLRFRAESFIDWLRNQIGVTIPTMIDAIASDQ